MRRMVRYILQTHVLYNSVKENVLLVQVISTDLINDTSKKEKEILIMDRKMKSPNQEESVNRTSINSPFLNPDFIFSTRSESSRSLISPLRPTVALKNGWPDI